jgi:hypothetical protein
MKILNIIILAIVALLSLAAGAAKIMKAPQEVVFFESLGISLTLMVALGVVQAVAGVMALVPRIRKIGAAIAAICFVISAIMILMSGQIGFGLISLLPAALAVYIFISTPSSAKAA